MKIPTPTLPPPPQPKMHKVCCANCPSQPGMPDDPECLDIATWPHQERLETMFACGWNNKRYCKGNCNRMGITNEDLEKLHELRPEYTVR